MCHPYSQNDCTNESFLTTRRTVAGISFRDHSLTGTIPTDLGKLRELYNLNLSGNYLTGPIPSEMGKLDNLGLFQVHTNRLSGTVPDSVGDLPYLREYYTLVLSPLCVCMLLP